MNEEKQILVTRRYIWKKRGSDAVYFKIVSDTLKGHADFCQALISGFTADGSSLDDIEGLGFEYLCEYDVSQVGVICNIPFKQEDMEVKDNENS